MSQPVSQDHICNICQRPMAGDLEKNCVGHNQVIYSLWNQTLEYKDYQQYLINKKRQQEGIAPLEFQPRNKKLDQSPT